MASLPKNPTCPPTADERCSPGPAGDGMPPQAAAITSWERFFTLLSGFYETLPELPAVEAAFVPADSLPQPQHDLLVHASDMTSTLARHYGEAITLRPLHRQQGPQWYRRHVVLETEKSRRAVEYGAMRLLLPLLSEAARCDVLAARTPLGAILARHGVALRHNPGGYFKIRSNRLIEQSLGLSAPEWLYGRCNGMCDGVGRVVAEVVEILPPSGPGFASPGGAAVDRQGRGKTEGEMGKE